MTTERPSLYLTLAQSEAAIVDAIMSKIGGRPGFDTAGRLTIDLPAEVKLLHRSEFTFTEERDPAVYWWGITIITARLCAPSPFVELTWKFTRRILAEDYTAREFNQCDHLRAEDMYAAPVFGAV